MRSTVTALPRTDGNAKWRHHRDPERHCGQGYRAQRPTVQASLQRIGGQLWHLIIDGDVRVR